MEPDSVVGQLSNHCVTALVQTDDDQALPTTAFDLLMNVVTADMAEDGLPPPQYLASFQEIWGTWGHGHITNMEQLRMRTNRRHVRENGNIAELLSKLSEM